MNIRKKLLNMKEKRRNYINQELIISVKAKYLIILIYALSIILASFFFNTPKEIIIGMKKIILAPSIILTDYMQVANIGAALFNSGLLMLISLGIIKINRVDINGPILAAVFTIGGFGLFGKNIYNIWSIFLGVYLYSLRKKQPFKRHIVVAFFGTALGPLVSQISFGFNFNPFLGVALGNIGGIIGGFILPALANHCVDFHKGFNIYNVGFAAGIIGTFFMSIFRAYGLENSPTLVLSQGNNLIFGLLLGVLFTSLIILGWLINGRRFKGYKALLQSSGRLISDFVTMHGFGVSLINMGTLGLAGIFYIILIKGELNGPTIGVLLTIAGFGAFGKHIRNASPIVIGVYIGSLFNIWEANSAAVILAALGGTTLAPIAGRFGSLAGILAGILHSSVVMNIGYLHGGMDLYNNGFSGGMVAALLIPVFRSLRKENDNEL